MRVQFRRLTEADLPKIMRMNQDFRQGFADPEATQRFLQNPANWFFAALWEETVIGFAYGYALPRLTNGSKNMLYLHEVGVAQRYQRQGIGMQMMCALQNICAKKQYRQNISLHRFAQRSCQCALSKTWRSILFFGGKDTAYFFPIQLSEIQRLAKRCQAPYHAIFFLILPVRCAWNVHDCPYR